jgi:ArsR family transcriptional regulator, arsenate/arsenite/antimonite-responsive transcriptional repressor
MARPLDRMAALFQALGDATRLRILGLLLTGEVCVCHIHESLHIPQPKASRHLAYLRRAGLVETRREGLWVFYRLTDGSDPAVGTIRQAVSDALTDVETVRRDTGRLQKKQGCGLPSPPAHRPSGTVDRPPRRRRGLPSTDYSERSKTHPTAAPAATSHIGLIE